MAFENYDNKLPTLFWRSGMLKGDNIFTNENISASETALTQYVLDLKAIVNPTEEEVLEQVKKVVLEFNRLNEEFDYFIDTLEREELIEFIDEVAGAAGLDTNQDITEEWREW